MDSAQLMGLVLQLLKETRGQTQEIRALVNDIRQIGQATLNMAEAQRDMLADHTALLKAMRDHDKQVLEALTSVLEK